MNIFEDAEWWLSLHERRGPMRGRAFDYGFETPYGKMIVDSNVYETCRVIPGSGSVTLVESFVEIIFRVIGTFRFTIHLRRESHWPAMKNCVKITIHGRGSRTAVYPVILRSDFKLTGRTKMEEVDFFLTMLKLTHEPA